MRTADVIALTDVELMVIESDALREQLGTAGPAISSALDRAEVAAGSAGE